MNLASTLLASLALTACLAGGFALAGDSFRLRAKLKSKSGATPIQGSVKYQAIMGEPRHVYVKIKGFAPGDVYPVFVRGVNVGAITISDGGEGGLEYGIPHRPVSTCCPPFPENFPELEGGELVQVGPLSGVLKRRPIGS